MAETNTKKPRIKVVVKPPTLDLHSDLGEKLYEIRCKRDAVALQHESLKDQNDKYNKIIIVLSLMTAFVETLKSQLELTDQSIHGATISNCAAIAPIAISTVTAIISSLMKFKKFPERMETLTKAQEKFNYTATRMRKLQEELNFIDHDAARASYIKEVMESYRDSLQECEATLYPDTRQKYFKRAQDNIIKIENQERKFIKNYRKINVDLEDLKTPNKRNDDDTDTIYTENSIEHMLDSISTTSDVEAIEVQIDDAAQSKV
jgi:hypothetical protein